MKIVKVLNIHVVSNNLLVEVQVLAGTILVGETLYAGVEPIVVKGIVFGSTPLTLCLDIKYKDILKVGQDLTDFI